jgi:hypothetical protein
VISLQSFAVTIDELIDLYDIPTYGDASSLEEELLAGISQDFISNPENKYLLKTKKGVELLKRQTKLLNIREIKRVFRKCEKETASRRNLYLRIITSAQKVELVEINCKENIRKFKTLHAFSNEIQHLAAEVELSSLQKELHQNSMSNIVRSYVHMKRNFSSKVEVNQVVKDMCKSSLGADVCSDKERLEYRKVAERELNKFKGQKTYSYTSAKDEMNERISRINDRIKKIKPKTDDGWFNNFAFDTSDPIYDEKSNKDYENYQQQYIEEATSGIGTLLMSPSIKEQVSGLKAREQDEFENSNPDLNKTSYWFEEHNKVSEKDMKAGVTDVLKLMEKQARKLHRLERTREFEDVSSRDPYQSIGASAISQRPKGPLSILDNRKRDIKRLVKTNPVAVGQLLATNPEYAQAICNAITDIESNDKTDEFWDDAFFWGGIVVGGVLMVTGLVVVGGAIIARSLATVAILKTVGTMVTVTGAVTGTIESTYYAKELAQAKYRIAVTEASFNSGNGDPESIIESKNYLKQFNEAKFNLAITLGFTAIDLLGLYSILKGARYKTDGFETSQTQKNQTLSKMTKTIDIILGDKKLIKEFKKLMRTHGGEDVSKFISILGQVSKKTRDSILLQLKIQGASKFPTVMKVVLRSVKECSK